MSYCDQEIAPLGDEVFKLRQTLLFFRVEDYAQLEHPTADGVFFHRQFFSAVVTIVNL